MAFHLRKNWVSAEGKQSAGSTALATGRRGNDFKQQTGDGNEFLGGLDILRSRSRALAEGNPYGGRALVLMTNHLVGTGITGMPLSGDQRRQEQLQKQWTEWTSDPEECDYHGEADFAGLQQQVTRCLVESGECLVLRHEEPSNRTVPLRLQVVEPDFIDTNRRLNALPKDGTVERYGITFRNGRRVGYWLWPRHPKDSLYGVATLSNFVNADRVIHVFRKDRPGQVRGFPWCTPLLLSLKDFDDALDAEQLRQKMAAAFVGFVTDLHGGAAGVNRMENIEDIEPGTLELLPPGRDVKLSTPPQAPNFESFTTVMLRRIAAGYNVSYEGLTGDFSKVNFSSAKMSANEFDLTIESWRASVLFPRFLAPVYRWWLEASGRGGPPAVHWTPPRSRLLDPKAEVEALVQQVRAGFVSWEDAVRRFGGDPVKLMGRVAETNRMLDEHGLVFDSDGRYAANSSSTVSEETEEGAPERQGRSR